MSSRDAETRPRLDDAGSRKTHDHHADVLLQHLPAKRSDGDSRRKHCFRLLSNKTVDLFGKDERKYERKYKCQYKQESQNQAHPILAGM